MWDWKERAIDGAFFRERVAFAVNERRACLYEDVTDAVRLVHGESDGLPGVIADRYGDTVVLQLTSAGAERWREAIADALLEASGAARVWERSDAEVRELEGLAAMTGPLRGAREPTRIAVTENALTFEVDLEHGHKTGFYLDQRENRRRVRQLAAGRDVLDGFCYTRRLRVERAEGRRPFGARDRQLGAGAGARSRQRRAQSPRRRGLDRR